MKTLIRALALLILLAPVASADKRVDEAVARAEAHLQKGKPEEAIKTMQKVVGQVPGPESQAAFARIQERAGQVEEAAATAAKAVEMASGAAPEVRAAALATLASMDLSRGSGADALKHAQEAAQLQPSATNLATLARAQARAQQGAEAVASAEKAVQAGGNSAAVHAAHAEALRAAGRASDAEAAARKGLALDPASSAAGVQLAWALLAQGKAAEAETVARKASETDARSGEAFAVLGSAVIAGDAKKWGDAIAQAQQGAFLNPRNPVVQVEVGRIFEAGGNLDQAVASYRKALDADPTYVPALLGLVEAQVRSGKTDDALASVQNLVRQSPQSANAQLLLGRLLLRKGDWAGAVGALEKAAAGLPRNAEAHARLGYAYQFTRRAPEALTAYRKAVELDPKNLDYRTTYGIILGINKDYAGGVAELKKVIETPGYKSPDAYLNLGWLYRNMEPRRAEESVAAYKKALELDPTNEQAALGMAWAYSYQKRYDDSIAAFNKAMELEPDLAADAYNGIAWGHFFKKDLAQAEAFLAKAKAAGRSDVRLADNIDRVRKGLEAKAAEPIDEPAPAPRVADPGTLAVILANPGAVSARCKAARDLGRLGSDGVSALIGGLKGDLAVQTCAAQALGNIGKPAAAAAPHLLAAAEKCLSTDSFQKMDAESMKRDAACNAFRNAVRDAVGKIR
jgi:tetratricopeptide (TPR) repeat protein